MVTLTYQQAIKSIFESEVLKMPMGYGGNVMGGSPSYNDPGEDEGEEGNGATHDDTDKERNSVVRISSPDAGSNGWNDWVEPICSIIFAGILLGLILLIWWLKQPRLT